MARTLHIIAIGWLLSMALGCLTATKVRQALGYQQLTATGGEAGSPSLSRDGKFVTYASDRADAGNLDIWIQAVDQGAPVRLTNNPARDYDPVFSADGKTIYFTSLREPSGIYRVPVSGGDADLVILGGTSPETSPDGQTLVFGAANGNLSSFDLGDKSTHMLFENFYSTYAPKWSPDGGQILFAGKAAKDDELEWWIAHSDGSPPRNTGLLAALRARGFSEAFAQAWLPGDEFLFAAKQQPDRVTLWYLKLSREGGIALGPLRATDNESADFHASFAAGHIAFDRTQVVTNLWSLPLDVNQGRITGKLQRLTSTGAEKGSAALSQDGRTLLYSEEQEGTFHLVLKDLIAGREKMVGPSSNAFFTALARDGSRYVYGSGPKNMLDIFARGVTGWRSWWSRSICAHCGMPRGLSTDGRFLLVWADAEPEDHIDLVDLQTGTSRIVAKHGTYRFYGPELSPDGAWISFIAKTGENSFHSYIARIPAGGSIVESDWIRVNPSSEEYQMAFWSPDGNLLYLLSEHGEGNLNWLDAQRLDAQTKQPAGEAFAVYHFENSRVPTMDPIWNHPAAAEGKIVLMLGDISTNVWIKETVH
jgi:Tol biopolymer transport system component